MKREIGIKGGEWQAKIFPREGEPIVLRGSKAFIEAVKRGAEIEQQERWSVERLVGEEKGEESYKDS